MAVIVDYPQRLIIDPDFIRWLLKENSNKNLVISGLLRINVSSKYNKKNHNVGLKKDIDELLKENIVKDNTLLRGGLSSFSFPEDIEEFLKENTFDDVSQRIILGIFLTEDKPFRAVIITTKDKLEKYTENNYFKKVKDLSIKTNEEAIQLILSFFNMWKTEKEMYRL